MRNLFGQEPYALRGENDARIADLEAEVDALVITGHPDLAAHDTLGLATQAELDAHAAAADPHTGYLKESVISGMAAPTIALGATAAAGAATTTISSDATIDAFDTTVPNVIEPDDAAAVGVVNFAARRDHEHGIVAAVAGASAFADSAAEGTATSFARSDHRHSREANPVTAHEAAADPHAGYVLESVVNAKGDIYAATADNTVTRLAVGSNGQLLTADSVEATGLKWVTAAAGIPATIVDAKGDLILATAADAVSRLAVGTNDHVLVADSTAGTGVKWAGPITTGAWTVYTPTVKFGATTATLSANNTQYQKIGRTVIMQIMVKLSSLNAGTGNLTITLPVAVRGPAGTLTYVTPIGVGSYADGGTGAVYPGIVTPNATTDVILRTTNAQPSVVFTHAVPKALAATDEIHATITYEAVS